MRPAQQSQVTKPGQEQQKGCRKGDGALALKLQQDLRFSDPELSKLKHTSAASKACTKE